MRRVFLVAVPAVLAFACGSFLAASDPDLVPGDAGAESSGGDGGPNGLEDDGSTIIVFEDDGGGVFSDAGDASVDAACPVKFCSPFDENNDPPFNWGRLGPSSPGRPAFVGTRTDTFVSPPRAFRIETSSDNRTEQWLEHVVTDALAGSVKFRIRIDESDDELVKVFALNCDGGDAAQIRILGNRAIQLSSGGSASTSGGANALGTWIPISLEFTKTGLGEADVTSTLRVANNGSSTQTFADCEPPLKFRLGATTNEKADWDLSFDDVEIDW